MHLMTLEIQISSDTKLSPLEIDNDLTNRYMNMYMYSYFVGTGWWVVIFSV